METELIIERYALSTERIVSIMEEQQAAEPFRDFFHRTAGFLKDLQETYRLIEAGEYAELPLELLEAHNQMLYSDILEQNYAVSYGNPDYAVSQMGETYGRLLCFLYAELRGLIPYVFEQNKYIVTIYQELFIEIYNLFETEEKPDVAQLEDVIYWFMSDYSDVLVSERVVEQIDPDKSERILRLIMEADFNQSKYLYMSGEYISDNERAMAAHLAAMPGEEIQKIADTYTEGYRIGFLTMNKDLSIKETVNIRYQLGFERIVRQAVLNFEKMGLKPVIYRAASLSINKRQQHRIGYYGGIPNKQFDYDHRADQALYMDKPFLERKLGVIRSTFEQYKELAAKHAGPAVIETFGEQPFSPGTKATACELDENQKKLAVYFDNESARITNTYIRGEERSFTIIAFPVPEIGVQFEEIFDEIVRINTLDYNLYQEIQQELINALDQGIYAHIRGRGNNRTDLKVHLYPLEDPEKETIFENCVADVNIPVGEVFTSPVLEGTNGILHVSQVYLNGLKYLDLELEFRDGRIVSYSCKNFEQETENKKYIFENICHNHEHLPMGEFAIGTNTTAYVTARRYKIEDKLPILIAEKMGPHFAVGDTCYSWSEDTSVYNPDGKEIVARDNEQSIKRKEDVSKAYYNCHTDITIPYDELGEIAVIKENGDRILLISDGRFVLPGTEKLNEPLNEEA